MAFLPWGKDRRWHDELSPKEATHMSREVKYMGMDVHKEATVIAVLNNGGKLVMESIVETIFALTVAPSERIVADR